VDLSLLQKGVSSVVSGSHQDRPENGSEDSPPLERQHHAAALCSERVRGSNDGASSSAGSLLAGTTGKRCSELNHGWTLGGEKNRAYR
jgi:hypothetical protein